MFKKFFKNKDIENALVAVNKDPDNILKLEILAKLYFNSHFYVEAIECFEKILLIDKNYLPAMEFSGKCYIKTKEYLKAYNILSELYKLVPDDYNVKLLLLSLQNAECESEIQVEILENLLQIENSIELNEKLAFSYLKTGQFSKSAIVFEKICSMEEKSEYLNKLSEIYVKLKKWQQAAVSLERLMFTDDFSTNNAKTLAEIYVKEKRFEEAKGIYELLIQSCPSEEEQFKEKIAQIYLLENNPDKTEEIAQDVIENNHYSVQAKFINAEALVTQKKYQQAIDFLREFYFDPIDKNTEQKIEEKIIETCILYSANLRENNKYTKAIDVMSIALRYNENLPEIYIELANISNGIKDFSSANEYMKIAKSLAK